MRKTGFLKLHLPDEHEYYNVELDQNQNFIRVDEKLKEHDTALTTIQQEATNTQKGIVQFGIEEGKALEGNMLARLAGAYGFGGDIQTPGVKNQNYIYYDNNTKKMYKCLNQNSDTSPSVQNYIPMDNFSILERLENFFRFKVINSEIISLKNTLETLFTIEECKFVIVNIDIYSNSQNLRNLSTLTIPYLFLKKGGKYYFSDFSTDHEKTEISLVENNLKIKNVNKTVIYVGEIFTI